MSQSASANEYQPTGILIQDEPVLSYTKPSDDQLAALMSRLPADFTNTEVLTELLFDRNRDSFFHFGGHTADTPAPSAEEWHQLANVPELKPQPAEHAPQLALDSNHPAVAMLQAQQDRHQTLLTHMASHGGDPRQIKAAELALVRHAALDPQLQNWCKSYPDRSIEEKMRAVAATIVNEKGYFGLDTDAQSMLLYDVRFLVACHHHQIADTDSWLEQGRISEAQKGAYFYPTDNDTELAELWLLKRLADGDIIETVSGLKPSEEFEQTVQQVLTAYTWDER